MVETHPLPPKRAKKIRRFLGKVSDLLSQARNETEEYSQLRTDIEDAKEKVEEALDRLD